MALPVNGSTHLIPAYYSIYRPRKDERLSWLTYGGWLTHISGHPSAADRAQDRKVRRPETDVLPLCHATNWGELVPEGKTNLDLPEARDSEWQWHQLGHMQVCTSLQTDNHTSTPPHHSVFYRPDAFPAGHRHNTRTLTRSHTSTKTRYTLHIYRQCIRTRTVIVID